MNKDKLVYIIGIVALIVLFIAGYQITSLTFDSFKVELANPSTPPSTVLADSSSSITTILIATAFCVTASTLYFYAIHYFLLWYSSLHNRGGRWVRQTTLVMIGIVITVSVTFTWFVRGAQLGLFAVIPSAIGIVVGYYASHLLRVFEKARTISELVGLAYYIEKGVGILDKQSMYKTKEKMRDMISGMPTAQLAVFLAYAQRGLLDRGVEDKTSFQVVINAIGNEYSKRKNSPI